MNGLLVVVVSVDRAQDLWQEELHFLHIDKENSICVGGKKKLFVPSVLICKPDVIHSISSSHTSQVHSVQRKFLPSY